MSTKKGACLNYTSTPWVDGCFVDRSLDTGLPWDVIGNDKQVAYEAAHLAVQQRMQAGIGHNPLIANHAYRMNKVNAAQVSF
jgi:hypothetical protein